MPAAEVSIRIGTRAVPIRLRRSRRARRILLRIDARDGAELVIPRGASQREALEFAYEKRAWLRERLDELPRRVPFVDGTVVPILAVPHRIRRQAIADLFLPDIWPCNRTLNVAGRADEIGERVYGWLRETARAEVTERAQRMARRIGARIRRISIRDPRPRWGSCNSAGTLSFSWRLVMAPEWVLDYVVAHEVAHLEEMNHGPAFWSLVRRLVGQSEEARAWLRDEGPGLHRYG
jgi:predicted metal-dependent hydrolase